ncbi:hypothetical protein DPSP01_009090 [Paraphaeosphaeria sporulosa]
MFPGVSGLFGLPQPLIIAFQSTMLGFSRVALFFQGTASAPFNTYASLPFCPNVKHHSVYIYERPHFYISKSVSLLLDMSKVMKEYKSWRPPRSILGLYTLKFFSLPI